MMRWSELPEELKNEVADSNISEEIGDMEIISIQEWNGEKFNDLFHKQDRGKLTGKALRSFALSLQYASRIDLSQKIKKICESGELNKVNHKQSIAVFALVCYIKREIFGP